MKFISRNYRRQEMGISEGNLVIDVIKKVGAGGNFLLA